MDLKFDVTVCAEGVFGRRAVRGVPILAVLARVCVGGAAVGIDRGAIGYIIDTAVVDDLYVGIGRRDLGRRRRRVVGVEIELPVFAAGRGAGIFDLDPDMIFVVLGAI
jgi:hypothetical protein